MTLDEDLAKSEFRRGVQSARTDCRRLAMVPLAAGPGLRKSAAAARHLKRERSAGRGECRKWADNAAVWFAAWESLESQADGEGSLTLLALG